MKKDLTIVVIFIFSSLGLKAQSDTNFYKSRQAISAAILTPVGEFSETHFAGVGIRYDWSKYRFGKLRRLPNKLLGFGFGGGVNYYLGKKESVLGNKFRYGNYLITTANVAAIYNPTKFSNIILRAGPTLSIYRKNAEAGATIQLQGNYYFKERVAINAGVAIFKYYQSNALWDLSIGASYLIWR